VRIGLLALAAGAVVLALAGCAAPPPPVAPSRTPGPPSFPRIAGTVLSTVQSVPGDWVVTVRVADPPSAYREARALLTAHSYRLTLDEPVVDGGNGQACTTDLCVGFSALTRPQLGRTLQYEVFHSTGVVG
jgi:hypothetical protein